MEFVIVSNQKLVQVHTLVVNRGVPVGEVGFSLYIFLFLFYFLNNFFTYFVFQDIGGMTKCMVCLVRGNFLHLQLCFVSMLSPEFVLLLGEGERGGTYVINA